MPSITGGGRYDELIGLFTDQSYPVTGTSLGIERIIVPITYRSTAVPMSPP
mgnify:CR=1 FL=1